HTSHNLFLLLSFLCLSHFYFLFFPTHLDLASFPTRRSSDLLLPPRLIHALGRESKAAWPVEGRQFRAAGGGGTNRSRIGAGSSRSEEHTSELQSRENLVCRLLLEKKKQNG